MQSCRTKQGIDSIKRTTLRSQIKRGQDWNMSKETGTKWYPKRTIFMERHVDKVWIACVL